MQGSSYSQWVRETLALARKDGARLIPLFDSHPSEPVELLRNVVERGFSSPITDRYTSAFSNGNPFLVANLAARYGRDPSEILTTTGATNAISILYRALLEPGDRILIEAPAFDLFHDLAGVGRYEIDRIERREPSYTVDPLDLAARIQPNTKLVILSNLHNPTGALFSREDLLALANVAEQAQVHILFDEVYLGYADPSARIAAANLSKWFISINSLTKMYALSTLRCGWIVAEPAIIDRARNVADRVEFGVSNLAHSVAALVLEDSEPFADHCLSIVEAARPVMTRFYDLWHKEELVEGRMPDYGCVSFPKLVGISDTIAFASSLLRNSGVIVAPGEYFGAPGHVRIGHAKPIDLLEEALDALTTELRSWRETGVPTVTQRALM